MGREKVRGRGFKCFETRLEEKEREKVEEFRGSERRSEMGRYWLCKVATGHVHRWTEDEKVLNEQQKCITRAEQRIYGRETGSFVHSVEVFVEKRREVLNKVFPFYQY